MKTMWLFLLILSANVRMTAQSLPDTVYSESFRHGSTQITEDKFEIKLTPKDRSYNERIKDSHGNDRYALSILPYTPGGDTAITAWQVKLADLNHRIYDNVLLVSLQANDNSTENDLWMLNPSSLAHIPAKARRIIKVEDFYVMLQVKQFHCTPPDSPYLDSLTVAVNFTNTDPRSATDAAK